MKVIAAWLVALAVAGWLAATRLPVHADFSYLLPDDAPSVRDLRILDARVASHDTTLVIVVAPDAATRARAVDELAGRVRALGPDLVERVDTDDADTRAWLKHRAPLLVPLADLEAASRSIDARIGRANPLFVPLDDAAADLELDKSRLDELRSRIARLDRSSFVSADGLSGLVSIRTAFPTGDIEKGRRLLDGLGDVGRHIAEDLPGVEVGLAGATPASVAEHDAILRGMLRSSAITAVLVLAILWLHLRSVRLVAACAATITVGTIVAFGLAALTVGQLNAATAFLGAVIAGNGVNYGIVLAAASRTDGLEAAMRRTWRPTLVAAAAASIAYGALAVTSFHGFSEFARIGGAGMLVCWAATYTLLPAMLRGISVPRPARGGSQPDAPRAISPRWTMAAAGAVTICAAVIAYRYIADDPFEYDLGNLRSTASDAGEARRWIRIAEERFGQGLWNRSYVAADTPERTAEVVAAFREPDIAREVGEVQSIRDLVPDADTQRKKLDAIAHLRTQIDRLHDPDLAALRPADDLRVFTAADLPEELLSKVRERDGTVGTLIAIRPPPRFDHLNGHDLLRFAAAIRAVQAKEGTHVAASGTSVIFADILVAVRSDGPTATLLAVAGLAVLIAAAGWRRPRVGFAVAASTIAATTVTVAACALAGVRVSFLNFVALPITLGIAVDYAVNVADGAATRATVLVCSLTTIVGYASLLAGDNGAIRSFGLASLLAELACIAAALVIAPVLATGTTRSAPGPRPSTARG